MRVLGGRLLWQGGTEDVVEQDQHDHRLGSALLQVMVVVANLSGLEKVAELDVLGRIMRLRDRHCNG